MPDPLAAIKQHPDPRINFTNPPFTFHRSLARYCLPLSKFAKLGSNTGKRLVVGAAIVPFSTLSTTCPNFANHTHSTTAEKRTIPRENGNADSIPKVLLVQRSSHEESFPDQWELPGGHAEFGTDQTLLESVVREVREETGLIVSGIVDEWKSFEYGVGEQISRQYNFVVVVNDPNQDSNGKCAGVVLNADEHQDWKWVAKDEADELDMSEELRNCVRGSLDKVALYMVSRPPIP